MVELDRGYLRLAAWVATTLVLVSTVYQGQLSTLVSGLGELLSSTLGTVFPAYPFLALLLVLTALRWADFHKVLIGETGLTSRPAIRIVGLLLIALPAISWALVFGNGGPSTYLAMELAASSLVLVAYGALIAINPTMWRIMLPYTSLYAVGLISPLFMLDAFGGPLANVSSVMAAGITGATGIHVAWQGVAFQFLSANGQSISAVVSPACSAAYSISIYLALLGLMYLDIGRGLGTTAKFAVVGVFALPLLNSARIAITIWFGYLGGSTAFWGIHDWLGYSIFFAFYLAVMVTYSRAGKPRTEYGRVHVPVSS